MGRLHAGCAARCCGGFKTEGRPRTLALHPGISLLVLLCVVGSSAPGHGEPPAEAQVRSSLPHPGPTRSADNPVLRREAAQAAPAPGAFLIEAAGEDQRTVLADLASSLSTRRSWLVAGVLRALRHQGLELGGLFAGAPRQVSLGHAPFHLWLTARGEGWETFDAALDPFVIVLPRSLSAPGDLAIAYLDGRALTLESKDLELVAAIYLELVPATVFHSLWDVEAHDLSHPLRLGHLRAEAYNPPVP